MKSSISKKFAGVLALLAMTHFLPGRPPAEPAEEARCEGPFVELRIEGRASLSEGALSRTGDHLILHDREGPVLASTRDGQILHRFGDLRGDRPRAAFSPRGTYVVLIRSPRIELYLPGDLTQPAKVFESPFAAGRAEWGELAMSSDESVLAATGRRRAARDFRLNWVSVFDVGTGQETLRLPESPYFPGDLSFSSDGALLALRPAKTGSVVQVWNVAERLRVTRIDGEFGGPPLGFLTGTRTLAQEDDMGAPALLDSSSGARIEVLPDRFLRTRRVVFSPLENVAAMVTDPADSSPRLEIWDFEKRSVRCFVDGPFPPWSPPSFSGDGRWLAVPVESEDESDDAALRVRIYAAASGGESRWTGGEVAVLLPDRGPAKTDAPAGGPAPPEIGGLVPSGDEGDHCHLFKVPFILSEEEQEEVLDLLQHPIGRERTEERTGELGFADFGHFVTKLGEEELTKRVFPIPGSDLKATAAVYYTDETMISAEGWDSISLALAVGPEEVEDPFRAAGASVFEGNYTGRNGLLRVKTRVETEAGIFLLGLQCDTTVRTF